MCCCTISYRRKSFTKPSVKQHTFAENETYFSYGPLVYAFLFAVQEAVAKSFPVTGFFDLTYRPVEAQTFRHSQGQKADYQPSGILIKSINVKTQTIEQIRLVHLAKTILRQVTF